MKLNHLYSFNAALDPQRIGQTVDGVRMDIPFEGPIESGGRLSGYVRGVDYFLGREDGSAKLNLHGTVTDEAGDIVSFHADGLLVPAYDGTASIREGVQFQTSAPALEWLNHTFGFVVGKADMNAGRVSISVYSIEEFDDERPVSMEERRWRSNGVSAVT